MRKLVAVLLLCALCGCSTQTEYITSDAQCVNSEMLVTWSADSVYYNQKRKTDEGYAWQLVKSSANGDEIVAENKSFMEPVFSGKDLFYIGMNDEGKYCLWENDKLIYTFESDSFVHWGRHSLSAANGTVYFLDGYKLKAYDGKNVTDIKDNVTAFSLYSDGIYYTKGYTQLCYYNFETDTDILNTENIPFKYDFESGYIEDISRHGDDIYFTFKSSSTESGVLCRYDTVTKEMDIFKSLINEYNVVNDAIYYTVSNHKFGNVRYHLYRMDMSYENHECIKEDIYKFYVNGNSVYINNEDGEISELDISGNAE